MLCLQGNKEGCSVKIFQTKQLLTIVEGSWDMYTFPKAKTATQSLKC